jgi:tetratricopeptide (TPR) repeat protein
MSDGVTAFGPLLRARRKSAGMSQEELAARSGLSVRAIGDLERGRTRCPYPASVRRLARALDLSDEARQELFAAAARRLAGAATARAAAAPVSDPLPVGNRRLIPRQLPGSVRQFVGRRDELTALTALLDDAGRSASTGTVIAAISGTAGVGKTVLAVHWARQVAGLFPDGQLYLNLGGYGPGEAPVTLAQALRHFLDAFAIPPDRIPAGLAAQGALYRSLLAGKRVLIVLDNAQDAEHVRPLLPGSPSCLVVVTSRSQLPGLVATEEACAITLGLLNKDEAYELLERRLGAGRLEAEPAAAAELIELCARLPLALAIATGRASARPGFQLGTLARELKDAERRLDALETGDAPASVRAVFSWSMSSLTAAAARVFRLLSLHPGPDITISAAASLAGVPSSQARRILEDLVRAHLLTEHAPGRYACHDLLRSYAAEQALAADDKAARQAATRRLVDHYLHSARAADAVLRPGRHPIKLADPDPAITVDRFADLRDALAWFDAQHQTLTAVAALAADSDLGSRAWQLAWTMETFWRRRALAHEACAGQRTALEAARRLGDRAAQAAAHRGTAGALIHLGRYADAMKHLDQALFLFGEAGEFAGQAYVHITTSEALCRQGRPRDALTHAWRAQQLARKSGDSAMLARALNVVGWSLAKTGSYQRALDFCRRALTAQRRIGDLDGIINTLDSLAYIHRSLGHHAEAVTFSRQAIDLMVRTGDRYDVAMALANSGDAHQAVGDANAARRAWLQAESMFAGMDGLLDARIERLRANLHTPAGTDRDQQHGPLDGSALDHAGQKHQHNPRTEPGSGAVEKSGPR